MKNNYYFLYFFFDSPFMRWLRVFVFFGVSIVVYLNIDNPAFVVKLLPFYFLLILQEFFIHFKLENSTPLKTIRDDIKHPIESVDYRMRAILERVDNVDKVIKQISNFSEVKYLKRLLDIDLSFQKEAISENEILKKAFLLVTQVGGKNIHPVDIFSSYIILEDRISKKLFNKGILEEDVVASLSWTRRRHAIDSKKHHGLVFTGSGVFDFFIYGWSQELSRYASNYTQEALSGLIPQPIGRDREYDLLITALSKNSSSNALIVGNSGVGKSTLVAKLALDSNLGNLPKKVSNKIVFKFYPERLLAGIENQGDLEARLVNLISELYHAGNIILYIPNIENIFGGGGFSVDLSGVLSEYLRSNKIKIIGSTTEYNYKEFILNKQELRDFFDLVEIEEPEKELQIFMLFEKAKQIEHYNNVNITYLALKSANLLSDSYITDGSSFPGRASKLLEDAVSYSKTHGERKITKEIIEKFVQEKTKILISEPTKEESQQLLNLESEIHKKVVSQDEAVKDIADAMRRVRSGMQEGEKPIASFLFLGPTGVGKTEAAKALASSYFGDESSMIRLDMSEYHGDDSVDRFLGDGSEETFIDKIIKNPFSEILLDEFEKADPSVHNLFLQLFDEGRLTDKRNRTASFKNSIIIATSNAGSEFIRESYKNGGIENTQNFKQKLIERLLQEGLFKPELINRFDDIVVFKPLSQEEVVDVAKLFLDEVVKEAEKKQITLSYDIDACKYIAQNAYSIEFGARNIKRFIQQSVENQLSKMILSEELPAGSTAKLTLRNNNLVIDK